MRAERVRLEGAWGKRPGARRVEEKTRLHVVEEAAGRGDEEVHPLLDLLRLHPAVGAAHDEPVRLRVLVEQLPGDAVRLHGELARGREDEGAGAVAGHPLRRVEELDAAPRRAARGMGGEKRVSKEERHTATGLVSARGAVRRRTGGSGPHQGMRKARVLPEPVRAAPRTSRPVRSGGMVRACTSVMRV